MIPGRVKNKIIESKSVVVAEQVNSQVVHITLSRRGETI
jgi:hypothetical protein